ncbi:MAG TPA: phosphatase PAP2 family protein [Bryobacteraceae bacterium]|nr:phosphatase PAP2 family protein [Bryobacteraceae bacterium]
MTGALSRAADGQATLQGGPGVLRPLDALVMGYIAVSCLALSIGIARGAGRDCEVQALLSLGIGTGMLLIGWATRHTTNRWLLFARLSFAPIFYLSLYHQVEVIAPIFHSASLDGRLAGADHILFGGQPSLHFQEIFPSRVLTEVFCFVYFAYFLCIPLVMIAAYQRGYAAAERVVFATSLCFYVCYTFFWLFPTVAPHYWFPPHTGPQLYDGYLFSRILYVFTSHAEIRGGAFPSSHIAVATLLTVYAYRETPRIFPILLSITLLLYPAVVYLHAHYFVDVPSGIAVGLLVASCSDGLQDRLGRFLQPERWAHAPHTRA